VKSRELDLCEKLLGDLGARCGVATGRDVKTLRLRCEHEGVSFLTLTLPSYCRAFERALERGQLAPGSFPHFKADAAGRPRFLGGFLRQIFAPTGELRGNARVDCILAVRQISLFCKKILLPCNSERVGSAIQAFVHCDEEAADLPESELALAFRTTARAVVESLGLDALGDEDPPTAKHGPGATVEGLRGNAKWDHRVWTERLECVGYTYDLARWGKNAFPFGDGERPAEDRPTYLEPGDEPPVKVVTVPKTLSAPRVIAIEPTHMQYAQQGLKAVLVRALEDGYFTRGHVNFTDQSINQRLALEASKSGAYATLDMSEASDRVSHAHFWAAFAAAPRFRAWADAARSSRARLPSGEILSLRKFASMGSALTFPIEATIFYLIIVASRLVRSGSTWGPSSILEMGRDVYVYGDDLIVPATEAPAICDDLEAFGLKVNRHKSFWTGQFRESCGVDAFGGRPVTPVYLRRACPTDRGDVSGLISSIATANQLWLAGYESAARLLRKQVEGLTGPLPAVVEESPCMGWAGDSDFLPPRRVNRRLQRVEYRCWSAASVRRSDPLSGYGALAKCLRRLEKPEPRWRRGEGQYPHFYGVPYEFVEEPSDPEHLETSPRRYGLALKRTWVPAIYLQRGRP